MSDSDRIERALIEQKKEILRERYGARFSGPPGTIPPEVEREWLDQILMVEALARDADVVTIRQFVGHPVLTPVTEIPESDIRTELRKVEEILASNGVFVDFIGSATPPRERYRFITEEVLDEQIEEIRLEGLETHYVYEAYHPDDEEDARVCGEEFLQALFGKSEPTLGALLPDGECYDCRGVRIPPAEFRKRIACFLKAFDSLRCHRADPLLTHVRGAYATVELDVAWNGTACDSARSGGSGIARLRLKRCDDGCWDLIQLCLPGWQF